MIKNYATKLHLHLKLSKKRIHKSHDEYLSLNININLIYEGIQIIYLTRELLLSIFVSKINV